MLLQRSGYKCQPTRRSNSQHAELVSSYGTRGPNINLCRAEEDTLAAIEAAKVTRQPTPPPVDILSGDKTEFTDADSDIMSNPSTTGLPSSTSVPKGILKKKGKPKLTNKEKKERSIMIERVVSTLPLEFRGSDPNLRRHIDTVIEGFLDREGRGVASAFKRFTLTGVPYLSGRSIGTGQAT